MKKLALSTALLITLATSASAQSYADNYATERFPRWYIGLDGGFSFQQDADVNAGAGITGEYSFDTGYMFGASLGYMPYLSSPTYANGIAFELELLHRQSDVDSLNTLGVNSTGSGDLSTTAYLFNLIYNFQTGTKFTPYLGGGLGWAQVEGPDATAISFTDNEDSVFAYQGLAGIAYEPELIPNTVWSLGYRYSATSDAEFSSGATSVELENQSHNAEVGVKLRF